MQYRQHIAIAIASSVFFCTLLYVAPRILTILAYFWPLFASTTVFLVAIIAFGGISKFADSSHQVHAEEAGQGLLDYVAAGQPELEHTHEEPQK